MLPKREAKNTNDESPLKGHNKFIFKSDYNL